VTSSAILLDASQIAAASDVILIDGSSQASLQLDDSPSAGAQNLVSLWQSNQQAMRALLRVRTTEAGSCRSDYGSNSVKRDEITTSEIIDTDELSISKLTDGGRVFKDSAENL
jgi:hypothetical protein